MEEKVLKRIEWIIAFAVILAVAYGSYTISRSVVKEDVEIKNVDVILDAGHGGSDPGKVGVYDILEKEINLAIVLKIKVLLEEEGIGVLLTREEDQRLDENGKEFSKTADMKDRVNIMNEVKPKVVVSVHQNSYTSPEIKGAQVFYFTHSEVSRKMAEVMQEELRKVDTSNTRQVKENDTYYLLKKTETPAMIVECGFLSNPEEAQKLATEEYQDKMAAAITEGIKSCLVIAEE